MDCLCDLDQQHIERNIERIKLMVNKPRHVCRKCARAANEEEYICKPVPIEPKQPPEVRE